MVPMVVIVAITQPGNPFSVSKTRALHDLDDGYRRLVDHL
jgi:hypothetical protein